MKKNSVIVIIVTYNRKKMLEECINHLKNQTYGQLDIMVIDNGSNDGTQEWLINQELISFRLNYNQGGAGGFNYGIKKAYKLGYKYMWIMDDDTMPKPDALENLMRAAVMIPEFGFLASRVEWLDGSLCVMNRPVKKKGMDEPWYRREEPVSEHECEKNVKLSKASFVSILLNRKAVEDIGLPIKEYFIWGDDMEYTQRISNKHACYYVQDSVVTHKMKDNVGSNVATDEPDRIPRYMYAYRNDCCTAKRNGFVPFLRYIKHVIWSIFGIVFKGKGHRLKRILVVIRGMIQGITFSPKYENV